ncbi:hypothetical protein OHZ10_18445 [Burkholderia arboris]|uniref:Uncharacterized protein n=1 Tax=Burkholderia arboris TaxID=488730 RepID=A0ABZ3DQS4_9BURK
MWLGFIQKISETGSCYFLFYGVLDKKYPEKADYYTFWINAFLGGDGSLYFKDRDENYNIDGCLYRKYEEWVIKTVSR